MKLLSAIPDIWHHSSPKRTLLYLGVLFFSIVSVYTNFEGIKLIFGTTSPVIGIVCSLLLGAGITLFMADLTLQVAKRDHSLGLAGVVTAYLLLAAISIFFTFNSLYVRLSAKASTLEADGQLRVYMRTLIQSDKQCIRKTLHLDEEELNVNQLKTDMDYEGIRVDRPGYKRRYAEKKARYLAAKAELDTRHGQYDEQVVGLQSFENDANGVPQEAQPLHATQLSLEVLTLAGQMGDRGCKVDIDLSEVRNLGADPSAVATSLMTVYERLADVVQGKAKGPPFYRFLLAFALSLVIDMTVFLAVVLSRARRSASQVPLVPVTSSSNWDKDPWA